MFYKFDSTRITLREFFAEGKISVLLSGILGKIFRFQLSCSTDDPPVDFIAPFEISEEALPPEIIAKFAPVRAELESFDFQAPIFHAITETLTSTQYYWATFYHVSGESCARIHYRRWTTPSPARTHFFPLFFSGFTDGTWLVSTAGKVDMLAPPQVRELRMVKASATTLWQAHSAELAREKTARTCYASNSDQYLRQLSELFHAAYRDFHLKRGVFVSQTPSDLEQQAAIQAAQQQAVATGSQYPEVHAQIEALQRKQASWTNAILLLIFSLIFFVGAGSATWNYEFALLIVPILIFHELGHYVTMRLFKYKNLRMFFIPLFGAAVSGRNYNVPGWKKVIVSLAGPVPGIIVGSILGILGLYLHQPWMNKVALLTIILNGLNLLPILPLDGGWVMHTLLFSRHYALDFAFRILAIFALLAWGIFGGGRLMAYIAIPMAISLPAAWKLARITTKLRKENLPQLSADSQSIPHLTAETIISEVKAAFPKASSPKLTAQHVVQVFETLNARPPGWLATIFYMLIHAGSIAAAVVFMGVILIGERGGTEKVLAARFEKMQCAVACDSIATWPNETNVSAKLSPHRNTLVATYKNRSGAEEAFQSIQSHLEEGAARLFGQTLLVAIPETSDDLRSRVVSLVQKNSTNLFIQTTNFQSTSRFSFDAPDESTAKIIFNETRQYFDLPA
jgi:Zn-dependent protease